MVRNQTSPQPLAPTFSDLLVFHSRTYSSDTQTSWPLFSAFCLNFFFSFPLDNRRSRRADQSGAQEAFARNGAGGFKNAFFQAGASSEVGMISTENHDLHSGEAARTWKGRVECRNEKHITFERFRERERKEGAYYSRSLSRSAPDVGLFIQWV